MNREATETFIHENFGSIIQDWPWENTPEYTVFRHADNHKWFALITEIKRATLARQNPRTFPQADLDQLVSIVNLKSDPDLIEALVHEPGIFPAYHMNKRHWITIPLDGTCPADRLKSLIDLSFRLTQSRARQTPPAML